MKCRNWINDGDGTWPPKELPGPENYMQWKTISAVFVVAAIMLNRIAEHALEKYRRKVEKLAMLCKEYHPQKALKSIEEK